MLFQRLVFAGDGISGGGSVAYVHFLRDRKRAMALAILWSPDEKTKRANSLKSF
jgi:hypothetical protein